LELGARSAPGEVDRRHRALLLTLLQDGTGLLVVHHGRRQQCQARVVMFFVVPTKKFLRESATVLNAAEAVGELGTIFHGAELTLRIGVVIGNVRAAMGVVRQNEIVSSHGVKSRANLSRPVVVAAQWVNQHEIMLGFEAVQESILT
jgi:hypothetical protein